MLFAAANSGVYGGFFFSAFTKVTFDTGLSARSTTNNPGKFFLPAVRERFFLSLPTKLEREKWTLIFKTFPLCSLIQTGKKHAKNGHKKAANLFRLTARCVAAGRRAI
ncbi:hypothetical protein [Intestinibacillus sp. Marseille-P6563]|uniref:hypothetical protein n=1 Tax=Intestinibacillus sp. Marseille-P6563 TaxID=2364792 RepID=UPI0013DFCDDC|nr:hypothetical protein [Intestinibacillus sp. Marseille-P6563]